MARCVLLGIAAASCLAVHNTLLADDDVCFGGIPTSNIFMSLEQIDAEGYSVGFSAETRTPIWACYHFKNSEGTHDTSRPRRKFAKHTTTNANGELVEISHDDYSHSGYDRGHMAPSSGIGRYYGGDAQVGTFSTTNICPQHPGLNQRCWERFEKQVADYYGQKFDDVWVVTGPIFDMGTCMELESHIRLPSSFFKVVVAKINDHIEMLGIVMPNERTERAKIYEFIQPVDDIEELTGLDLFHELADDIEGPAEDKGSFDNPVNPAWSVSWELRPVFAGSERPIRIQECE